MSAGSIVSPGAPLWIMRIQPRNWPRTAMLVILMLELRFKSTLQKGPTSPTDVRRDRIFPRRDWSRETVNVQIPSPKTGRVIRPVPHMQHCTLVCFASHPPPPGSTRIVRNDPGRDGAELSWACVEIVWNAIILFSIKFSCTIRHLHPPRRRSRYGNKVIRLNTSSLIKFAPIRTCITNPVDYFKFIPVRL